jgi:hypothetical protein
MNWACRSLLGNIVLVELIFGLSLFVAFCAKAYSDDELDGSFLLLIAAACVIAGFAGGVLFWFGLTRPLLAQRGNLPGRQRGE